jgi:UDP-glucose 4-epimerase
VPRNILITGAAGGIGSALASHLKGDSLILVDNLSSGSQKNLTSLGVVSELLNIDLSNDKKMEEVFSTTSISHIVHLAATTSLPECQSNPVRAIENNVANTARILELARQYGSKLIFASTSAVYESNLQKEFSEEDEVHPHLIYPATKYFSEMLCRSYAEDYGVDIIILRLFNVIGPFQNSFRASPPLVNYLVQQYLEGQVPNLHHSGEQLRDYVSVFDVCEAFSKSLTYVDNHDGLSVFNISSGVQTSVIEIDRIIRNTLGLEIEPNFKDATSFWNQYTNLFIGSKPLKSEVISREVTKQSLGINSLAKESLGIQFEAIEKWLPEIVNIISDNFYTQKNL